MEVLDGEIYVDMSKKPQKPIWELAAVNNERKTQLTIRKNGKIVEQRLGYGKEHLCGQ